MSKTLRLTSSLVATGVALMLSTFSGLAAAAPDVAGAEALMKKSNCTKCHALDKKKDGPSLKDVAAKYKGKADAEAKLYTHVTTGPKVKVDGEEEDHPIVKSKNEAEVRNLVQYILSR